MHVIDSDNRYDYDDSNKNDNNDSDNHMWIMHD